MYHMQRTYVVLLTLALLYIGFLATPSTTNCRLLRLTYFLLVLLQQSAVCYCRFSERLKPYC